jgi:hypothetical protein
MTEIHQHGVADARDNAMNLRTRTRKMKMQIEKYREESQKLQSESKGEVAMNSLVPSEHYVSIENPYERLAREEGDAERLTFKDQVWTDTSGKSMNDARLTAHLDYQAVGYRKFGPDGVDLRVGLVRENYRPPPRDSLGDLDETKWLPGLDGQPEDPWQEVIVTPFTDEGGKRYVFAASRWLARKGTGELAGAYGWRDRQGLTGLPIIKLSWRMRRTKFGPKAGAYFEIVGWTDEGESPAPQPPKPRVSSETIRPGLTVTSGPQPAAIAPEYSADDMGPGEDALIDW